MAPASDVSYPDDFYELLQISPQASESEIRRAYRKTTLLYHPDKVKPTAETSAKFQLLQVALTVLTDPVEKEKYDQNREAKERRKAENDALEGRRKQMKEDLEKRETSGNGAGSTQVNGVKRKWTDQELEVKRIAEQNAKRKEMMMQARAQQSKARAEVVVEAKPADAIDRSVKVRWVKEGDGLDVDSAALTGMCNNFGAVENVLVFKDKRRLLPGREKKVVVGTAVVVFESLLAAKKAVAGGAWTGMESATWAAEREPEVG